MYNSVPEIIRDKLGLSCIENYILLILSQANYNYTKLFFDSYISFDDIIYDFFINKKSFVSFDKIKALQFVAQDENVLSFDIKKLTLDEIFEIDKNIYKLILVSKDFIQKRYHYTLWRDEHYILLKSCEKSLEYNYINDVPYDEGVIDVKELEEIYKGQVFNLTLLTDECILNENVHKMIFIDKLKTHTTKVKYNYANILDTTLRDMVGILKISRKRLYKYSKNYYNVEFMTSYLDYLEKLYLKSEYMRVRKTMDKNYINKTISELYYNDKNIINNLIRAWEEK